MHTEKTHLLLTRVGYAALLKDEMRDLFGLEGQCLGDEAVLLPEASRWPEAKASIFARQVLPHSLRVPFDEPQAMADTIWRRLEVTQKRANRQGGPWTLHAVAPDDNAATQLAAKLASLVLAKVRARAPSLASRYLDPEAMLEHTDDAGSFVLQIYVATDGSVFFSTASFAQGISPYIGGNLRMRAKVGAPSRSARKIEEAYLELGRFPEVGETAVDLGAAPGGWTFSLARRGAQVTAVDAAALALPERKALLARVDHVKDNGLRYQPPAPVDWLCCDMIVAPHETLKVLRYWLSKGWMQHFVINLKLPKQDAWQAIKDALQLMNEAGWPLMRAKHLFHDRWEITLLGSRAPLPVAAKASAAH